MRVPRDVETRHHFYQNTYEKHLPSLALTVTLTRAKQRLAGEPHTGCVFTRVKIWHVNGRWRMPMIDYSMGSFDIESTDESLNMHFTGCAKTHEWHLTLVFPGSLPGEPSGHACVHGLCPVLRPTTNACVTACRHSH